jgi:AcrR family transcriptional regulator
MVRRRARQVHQKVERRQEILRAALALFKASSFQAITMAGIAEKSQLGKGTIFIYFKTKEELFLFLAEEGLLGFFEAMDENLSSSRVPLSAGTLTALVVEALEAQPQLPRLLGILHTVLEHNVDRLTILKFKEFLANRVTRTARKLEQRLPFLGHGEGLELMFQIHMLILGVGQVSDPAPVVKELLGAPGLHIFDIPFRPFFERTLMALVLGLEQPKSFLPQRSLFDEPTDVQG